jgi:hypothetical protein
VDLVRVTQIMRDLLQANTITADQNDLTELAGVMPASSTPPAVAAPHPAAFSPPVAATHAQDLVAAALQAVSALQQLQDRTDLPAPLPGPPLPAEQARTLARRHSSGPPPVAEPVGEAALDGLQSSGAGDMERSGTAAAEGCQSRTPLQESRLRIGEATEWRKRRREGPLASLPSQR